MKNKMLITLVFLTLTVFSFFLVRFARAARSNDFPDSVQNAPIDDPTLGGIGMELVEQNWGTFYTVEVSGTLAYASVGQRLYLISVVNPSSPMLVARSKLLHNPSKRLDLQGRYAYLADPGIAPTKTSPGAGIHIMDVSNPQNPFEAHFYASSKYGYMDVDVLDGYAFVADGGGNLQVIDIQNPAAPVTVKSLPVAGDPLIRIQVAAHAASGKTYAYLLTRKNDLIVVDVTNPGQASVGGGLSFSFYNSRDMVVDGDRMFVSDDDNGNLHLVDISIPLSPVLVDSTTLVNYEFTEIELQGNILFTFSQSDNPGLRMLDASGAGLPVELGRYSAGSAHTLASFSMNSIPYGLYADDRGLHLINAFVPTTPTLEGSLPEVGAISDVEMVGDLVYMTGNDWGWGLRIYRRTGPGALVPVGELEHRGRLKAVRDGKAYLLSMGYYDLQNNWISPRLSVINVSDPANPLEQDYIDLPSNGNDLCIYGDYAYIAIYEGVYIVDIHDPTQLVEAGRYDTYNTTGSAETVLVAPNPANPAQLLAFVSSGGLLILDVTNLQSINQAGHHTLGFSGFTLVEPLDVQAAGSNLIGAEGPSSNPAKLYLATASSTNLALVEVTDPISVTRKTVHSLQDTPHELLSTPGRLYVAGGLRGGIMYEVDSTKMTHRGEYRYPYRVTGLAVHGNYIYLAAGGEGLFEVWQGLETWESIPTSGGVLTGEHYSMTISIPADTFTDTVFLRVTPRFFGNMPPVPESSALEYFFNLRVSYSWQPAQPYQMEFHYDTSDVMGTDEGTLAFYFSDGTAWVKEPTSMVDTVADRVRATPNHMSFWAVTGKPIIRTVYIPIFNR